MNFLLQRADLLAATGNKRFAKRARWLRTFVGYLVGLVMHEIGYSKARRRRTQFGLIKLGTVYVPVSAQSIA
ncbi:hypothetical protein E4582_07080 [Luteimonas yindakuii]|uniref:Uncharacterized protein n=1 Tax=Luteimonas yindakuii TaxID=2565782 RepID=A0A4Z1RLP9_9GAMM|nr:hypothetical protein [Luteimonas yindakuii]TKS54541.1 hypothetical protein E4582_07080 [Luteimonas yindakuii]